MYVSLSEIVGVILRTDGKDQRRCVHMCTHSLCCVMFDVCLPVQAASTPLVSFAIPKHPLEAVIYGLLVQKPPLWSYPYEGDVTTNKGHINDCWKSVFTVSARRDHSTSKASGVGVSLHIGSSWYRLDKILENKLLILSALDQHTQVDQ